MYLKAYDVKQSRNIASTLSKLRHRQGRLEKFRAEGQKFRLGPLVSGAPKSSDEQKKRS